MLNSPISRHTLLALSLMISMPAFCAVSAEQAAQLDQQLTPMGAERAGNTDGSIPAWDGGYKPSTSGGALVDPYAAEHPAEFFAVCCESFFTDPLCLRQVYPAVYRQLSQFFSQDPALRFPATRLLAGEAQTGLTV